MSKPIPIPPRKDNANKARTGVLAAFLAEQKQKDPEADLPSPSTSPRSIRAQEDERPESLITTSIRRRRVEHEEYFMSGALPAEDEKNKTVEGSKSEEGVEGDTKEKQDVKRQATNGEGSGEWKCKVLEPDNDENDEGYDDDEGYEDGDFEDSARYGTATARGWL